MSYLRRVKIIEIESRRVVARTWGRERNRVVNGKWVEFQFYKTERVTKIDNGDGCIAL